jgi:hypothetical protein
MAGGGHPLCGRCGAAITLSAAQARRAEGIAWARDWRERNKPLFDAMYGQTGEVRGER